MRVFRPVLVLAFLFSAATAWGQAVASKEPSGTHIFPAGGRRGTVVPVRVGGECLPPSAHFHVWGLGVTAPELLGPRAKARYEPSPSRIPADADNDVSINYPKEWKSKITIAANAPLGVARWRVTCGWGGTQPRPFIVGDLPEFVESEPNSDPDHAERITLPITVNGQIAGERDIDFYVFHAEKGDVVVCDLLAARIGSPLDPVLEVRDANGRRLSLQEVRVGSDPVFAFRANSSGDFMLNIANVSFRGGPEFVYRMTISKDPYVAFMLPTANKDEVENFALTGGDDFRSWKEKRSSNWWRGAEADVVAAQNRSANRAMSLAAPADVVGRFLTADAEDWFSIGVKKGESISLTCQAFPATSAASPVMAIEDSAGRLLVRVSSADSANRTCGLEWKAPADGVCQLRVSDLQHGTRGGPEFLYRLSVRPTRPSVALTLATDCVNVVQGGKADLDLIVERAGGFSGAIDLKAIDLPAGVRLETTRVPENVARFKLVFAAADDARPANAALTIHGAAVGTAGKETGVPAQVARATPVGGPEGVLAVAGRSNAIHLTVQHKPIFHLTCNEAYQYAHRGTVYPYTLQVERLNGFEGEITLQICDRQVQDLDGIEVVERVVPAGVKEIGALVYLPESMHANAQHHSRPYVQGYAFFTDKWGQKQAMVALCDKRCMIRAMPPVAKLKAGDEQVVARPGVTVACKLVLARTSHFAGPADIELLDPSPGFILEKTRFEAGQTSVTATVRVDQKASIAPGTTLRFRATGRLPADGTVVSEATIIVRPGK